MGIEYGISPNWTLKAEYYWLGLAHWRNSGALFPGDSLTVSRDINVFTVGANYKF